MSDEEYHLQQLEEELDEEIKKEIEEEEYNDLMARYEFDDGDWETLTYKKEYKELQSRIDKAIEYINNRIYYFNEMERDYMKEYFPSESREYENILDILKGSDSNE